MNKKTKTFIKLAAIVPIIGLGSVNLTAQQGPLGAPGERQDIGKKTVTNYCYGLKRINGKIRCSCTGGSKCYAAWQDL